MGTDIATFLAIYGSIIDGNGLSWSIGMFVVEMMGWKLIFASGGPSSALPSVGLLSQPQGISGSHNKYESDASPTRPDLYQ